MQVPDIALPFASEFAALCIVLAIAGAIVFGGIALIDWGLTRIARYVARNERHPDDPEF